MNQRTHAWIAIRALKLIEEEGKTPKLTELLMPYVKNASIGAWIPDKRDAKIGGANTQNHVFKISPYDGPNKTRFKLSRTKMNNFLGQERKIKDVLENHRDILDNNWWDGAYKATPAPGKHLANRAMALTINNIDMLILGDPAVQTIIPGRIPFVEKIDKETRIGGGQIAMFFFMLSHFIADALMPCHCDERDLADYANGLHMELEKHWGKIIGPFFDDDRLEQPHIREEDILEESKKADAKFKINFNHQIPGLKSDDVWEEIVMLCRASFAVASIIAPPANYPYKPANQAKINFETMIDNPAGKTLIEEIDNAVMHDAVLNVAMIWKFIWEKFS